MLLAHNRRHDSYHRQVLLILMVCILVSGAFAMLSAYLVARSTATIELTQSEVETAENMLALRASTDLRGDEIARMSDSSAILISRMLVDASPLKEGHLAQLERAGYVTLPNGYLGMPVTYILLDGELFSIAGADSFGLYRISFLRMVAMWVSFAAIFALLSMLAAGRISRPVTMLSAAMERVSQEDFDISLPENEPGEVGQLMRDFNRMSETLGHNAWLQKDFIANISHEFRTPIASVKGYATLLQMEGLTEEQRREFVRIIYDESDRLSRLSDTLLRLSALEHQAGPDTLSDVRLDEQIRQTIVRLEPVWGPKGIEWELDLDEKHIQTDGDMLTQVWFNLLQNAIKFSPAASTVEVSLHQRGGEVVAVIRDHGDGMDEETQKHIFERFYRGDTARSGEGTGIGLCLVQRILTLLGGRVSVASKPGEGSAFTVELPLPPPTDERRAQI